MAVTTDDVLEGQNNQWTQVDTNVVDRALSEAQDMAKTTYGGQVSRMSTQENQDLFVTNLARHYLEESVGGEAQSESQQGGSTSYNTVTGESMSSLQSTRYGRRCLDILRGVQSIGIVKTRR